MVGTYVIAPQHLMGDRPVRFRGILADSERIPIHSNLFVWDQHPADETPDDGTHLLRTVDQAGIQPGTGWNMGL